jgi:hypothetical protein
MLMGSRVVVKALPLAPAVSARAVTVAAMLKPKSRAHAEPFLVETRGYAVVGGIVTHLVVQNRS